LLVVLSSSSKHSCLVFTSGYYGTILLSIYSPSLLTPNLSFLVDSVKLQDF
jgi:hypothetical protein